MKYFIQQWHFCEIKKMNLLHWANLWRLTCGWRRWASSLHCRHGRKRSWLHPERTTYRPDPNSSEDLQSRPVLETETQYEAADLIHGRFLFVVVASHTLHPDTMSPPAQIMVLLTLMPHQSLRLHTLCSTTGSKACCSLSGIGPWAERRGQGWKHHTWYTMKSLSTYYTHF